MSISKYWKVYDCLKEKVKMKVTIEEAQKEIVNVLKNNIRKRWTAKNFQTAALLLSGGIDSAILCSVISEMKDIPLIAYTASFKKAGQNYDESDMARVVAENCGVKHEVIEIDFDVLCNHIYEILGATDEPMANRTYLAVAMLINVASENCDCIFTGDGGDEIFLGYPQYQRLCKAQNIYLSLYPFRKLLLSNIVRKFIPRKLITIMECSNMDSPEQMFSVNAVKNAKKAVLDVKDSLFYSAPWEKYKEWCIQKNLLDLYYGTQAPLRKWNDIASENKLIHYAPLLDSSVIMKASLFPRKYKMQGKNNKVVLRNIINNRIPAVGKLPKHGFNVPIDEWMRGPLRDTFEDVTSESFIKKQGLFRVEEIIRLKQIFLEGKSDYQNDAVTFMWNYFVFQVWYREAMGK